MSLKLEDRRERKKVKNGRSGGGEVGGGVIVSNPNRKIKSRRLL